MKKNSFNLAKADEHLPMTLATIF